MYIERFLESFSDQSLANLQAAAEAQEIVYVCSMLCLVGRHSRNYQETMRTVPSAFMAEREYANLAQDICSDSGAYRSMGMTRKAKFRDDVRCAALLPLIANEWTRREALKAPAAPVEIEQPEEVFA